MCVIIDKPANKSLNKDDVSNAYWYNSDGFGYMCVDDDGRLFTDKFLPQNPDEVLDVLTDLHDVNAVLHFRYNTRGKTSVEMAHPFTILDIDKGDPIDLAMVHNGTLSKYGDKDTSDTFMFLEQELKPILKSNPEYVDSQIFWETIADVAEVSKLVFMDSNGNVYKVNEELGDKHDGMWVSNTTSFTSVRSTTKTNYPWSDTYTPLMTAEKFSQMTYQAQVDWITENIWEAAELMHSLAIEATSYMPSYRYGGY
jgi:predicted glutamine amidotransferase